MLSLVIGRRNFVDDDGPGRTAQWSRPSRSCLILKKLLNHFCYRSGRDLLKTCPPRGGRPFKPDFVRVNSRNDFANFFPNFGPINVI